MKTLPFLLLFILIGCNKDQFLTDDNGTFTDSRNKHDYKWVKIGDQIWMAENLAYLPAVGPPSYGSDTEPRYYVYDYDDTLVNTAQSTANYDTYGVLYNWEAARVACPGGWHLPKDEEWKTLEKNLGMNIDELDKTKEERASGNVGKQLKAKSGWNADCNGENSSGFNAIPGGFRTQGYLFANLSYGAIFWSASPGSLSEAWSRGLYCYNGIDRNYYDHSFGLSVRCIKDE